MKKYEEKEPRLTPVECGNRNGYAPS